MSKYKSKDKQKKQLSKIERESIATFRKLCFKCGLKGNPSNRFVCMNLLTKAIREKKGAYTEEYREDWLSILYACLAAPDGYFLENPTRLEKKRIRKYETKRLDLLEKLKRERINERSMYTYIDCVRDYWARVKTRGVQRTKNNPYANDLREKVYQALKERIKKNSQFEEYDSKYQETLRRIFIENQHYINYPAFFLFLPYYVFFELAKCEGLIREKDDAFSIIQLGKKEIRWSIRNTPLIPSDEEIPFSQILSLYKLVEGALCQSLQNQNYRSVGRQMWIANCKSRQGMPGVDNKTEDDINRIFIKDAIDFSVPFWKYERWADLFANAFDEDEDEDELSDDALAMDIHKLLSFAFRPAGQAQKEREKILEKYKGYEIYLRKHGFKLSELLDALCMVYNLRFFDTEKPFNQDLQNAVERLTGFLIACDRLPVSAIDDSVDFQWLMLIRSGYPYDAFETRPPDYADDIDRYLKNPSRILFSTVFMRWNMLLVKKPKRYLLTDTVTYSHLLKKLSNSLYTALCSEQAILRDLLIWGGINVCLDRDHINSMWEAFHVWSVWHRNESLKYQGLMKYLGYPESQNTAAKELTPVSSPAIKLELSDYEFDEENTPELEVQKRQLFDHIPILRETFGEPEQLSDFQYALILYCIFRVLRDQMCYEAYEICTKILDNHFGPPYMFRDEAFTAMLRQTNPDTNVSEEEETW